jgi:hypothetical protein
VWTINKESWSQDQYRIYIIYREWKTISKKLELIIDHYHVASSSFLFLFHNVQNKRLVIDSIFNIESIDSVH